jgi:thiol-disulfide isomerase/thioredoxin
MIQKALSSMAVLVLLLAAAACNPPEDAGKTGTSTTGTTGTSAATSTTTPPATTWGNAPDFTYSTFDGQQKKLSQHLGKPVVVNFWAVFCPPCKHEMPVLQAVYDKHRGDFDVLVLAVDPSGDPQGYLKENGFTMPAGLDVNGFQKYGSGSIPLTLFIDRNGNKVGTKLGGMSKSEFEGLVGAIL